MSLGAAEGFQRPVFVFRTVSLGGGFVLNGSFGIYVTMTDIPIIFENQVADS